MATVLSMFPITTGAHPHQFHTHINQQVSVLVAAAGTLVDCGQHRLNCRGTRDDDGCPSSDSGDASASCGYVETASRSALPLATLRGVRANGFARNDSIT